MEKKYETKNIFLVGLMGAGKTTVGRLGLDFVDSDREIESRTGVNISTIFEIEGEEGFRKREARIIKDLTALNGYVLATGGGVILHEENRKNLQKNGFVVYLNAPPHVLWERTRNDKNATKGKRSLAEITGIVCEPPSALPGSRRFCGQ